MQLGLVGGTLREEGAKWCHRFCFPKLEGTDHSNREISCNSGTIPGAAWRLLILPIQCKKIECINGFTWPLCLEKVCLRIIACMGWVFPPTFLRAKVIQGKSQSLWSSTSHSESFPARRLPFQFHFYFEAGSLSFFCTALFALSFTRPLMRQANSCSESLWVWRDRKLHHKHHSNFCVVFC